MRVWESACSITVTVLSPPERRKQTGVEEGFISALTFKSTSGQSKLIRVIERWKPGVKLQRLTMASSEGAPTIAIQQVARARIEPGTAGLRVRRTYHSATLPPLFSIPVSWMSSRHLHIDLSSIPRNSRHCQWARKPPFIPKGFSSFLWTRQSFVWIYRQNISFSISLCYMATWLRTSLLHTCRFRCLIWNSKPAMGLIFSFPWISCNLTRNSFIDYRHSHLELLSSTPWISLFRKHNLELFSSLSWISCLLRRGSRINSHEFLNESRRRKLLAGSGSGGLPQEIVLDF